MTNDRGRTTGEDYHELSNVETQHNFVIPEDFPEGPYGSPINRPLGKSTPWEKNQRPYSAFNYEFKNLHQDLPRRDPGHHPTHDDPKQNEEQPYTTQ